MKLRVCCSTAWSCPCHISGPIRFQPLPVRAGMRRQRLQIQTAVQFSFGSHRRHLACQRRVPKGPTCLWNAARSSSHVHICRLAGPAMLSPFYLHRVGRPVAQISRQLPRIYKLSRRQSLSPDVGSEGVLFVRQINPSPTFVQTYVEVCSILLWDRRGQR